MSSFFSVNSFELVLVLSFYLLTFLCAHGCPRTTPFFICITRSRWGFLPIWSRWARADVSTCFNATAPEWRLLWAKLSKGLAQLQEADQRLPEVPLAKEQAVPEQAKATRLAVSLAAKSSVPFSASRRRPTTGHSWSLGRRDWWGLTRRTLKTGTSTTR